MCYMPIGVLSLLGKNDAKVIEFQISSGNASISKANAFVGGEIFRAEFPTPRYKKPKVGFARHHVW